jgi:hypothetical protein
MDKQKEIQNYILRFASAIEDVVVNKENENYIEIDDKNATEVMTGLILGAGFAFNRLTGNECNYLEFTHIANQLVVQYLMRHGDVGDKKVFNE